MWLYLIIALPFLFLIGVIYNSIKEQKKLEGGKLKQILAEREKERAGLKAELEQIRAQRRVSSSMFITDREKEIERSLNPPRDDEDD